MSETCATNNFQQDYFVQDRLVAALQQIKVVCEDNRRAKDIGPSEEMTLYFIQQISEQALRASVSSPSGGE